LLLLANWRALDAGLARLPGRPANVIVLSGIFVWIPALCVLAAPDTCS
jgi:hypothetical protein